MVEPGTSGIMTYSTIEVSSLCNNYMCAIYTCACGIIMCMCMCVHVCMQTYRMEGGFHSTNFIY